MEDIETDRYWQHNEEYKGRTVAAIAHRQLPVDPEDPRWTADVIIYDQAGNEVMRPPDPLYILFTDPKSAIAAASAIGHNLVDSHTSP